MAARARRRLCDGDRLEYFHGVVMFLVKSATGIPLFLTILGTLKTGERSSRKPPQV
jgi:hypothetical protein